MDFISYISSNYNINLNDQQQKAVLHKDGPLLLIAVPGAGKTTVMVCRIANMVLNHGIKPENILTLTFSRAAARDMKHRFERLFGKIVKYDMSFSTIHSFSYSVIQSYVKEKGISFPAVIEDEESPVSKLNLLRQIYQVVNNDIINDDKLEELASCISYVKNMMLKPVDFEENNFDIKSFGVIYSKYEQYKKENRYIDYDDMLTSAFIILRGNPGILKSFRHKYTYVNIDESQDTSLIQHEIIKLLVYPHNNIFMVGDEDQSIYKFRGADPKALLEFKNTYSGAQVYLMEQNFRSTGTIVTSSNKFIKQNKTRYQKNMFSLRETGEPINSLCFQDKSDQYQYIMEEIKKSDICKDIAILFRNNISTVALVDVLERSKIPFYLRESRTYFFKHWVTRDIIGFLKLAMDETDIEAFEQIYFKMNAYISKAMVEHIKYPKHWRKNVFDSILTFPKIHSKQFKIIETLKRDFRALKKSDAYNAIEIIENNLNYSEYLKDSGKKLGYSMDSLNLMLNTLKYIASNTDSISALITRIEELQDIMEDSKRNKYSCNLTLSTIHSSKGLEFDRVFLVDLFEDQLPSSISIENHRLGKKDEMEEEVRLFYVAATRAKNQLDLLAAKYINGKLAKPSRFIDAFIDTSLKQKSIKNLYKKKEDYDTKDYITDHDVTIGAEVRHIKYGLGEISAVDDNSDIVEVDFIGHGVKKLSLRVCVKAGILKFLQAN
jgi:DNA helicase II / ATP-dependent DNA helicase PcrA